MAVQFYIKQSGSWVDFSNYVLKLGNFDLWLHNYDFSLRIPICAATLGEKASFEVGEFAKIVQDGKNIFPCYISSSKYNEEKKQYDIKLSHVFGKLKEQKLLWALDTSFQTQLSLAGTEFDAGSVPPLGFVRGYRMLWQETTSYDPTTVDDWLAYVLYNWCGGLKYKANYGNYASDYTAIWRSMYCCGTNTITGSDNYQNISELGSLFDILDYMAIQHTVITWDSTNENFIFWPVAGWGGVGYLFSNYSAPVTNTIVNYSETQINNIKKVIRSGRTDNRTYSATFDDQWYLDTTDFHEWNLQVNPVSSGSETEIYDYNISRFNHLYLLTTGAGLSVFRTSTGTLSKIKSNRFSAIYNFYSYETNMLYDIHDEYYINIADVKAVFKNGIYNANITLMEVVS